MNTNKIAIRIHSHSYINPIIIKQYSNIKEKQKKTKGKTNNKNNKTNNKKNTIKKNLEIISHQLFHFSISLHTLDINIS